MNDVSPTGTQRPQTERPIGQVTIIGVGLLGGSVAWARKRFHRTNIVAWARSESSAKRLSAFGWLDRVTESFDDACRDADVIVVASPVSDIADLILRAGRASATALLTDVGSTKSTMVDRVLTHPEIARRYVAAHPIAGSEKSGAQYASMRLFDRKLTILTPHAANDPDYLDRGREFWESLGCRVIEMSPEQHDDHLAAVSHVPHLASALVARQTPPEAFGLVGSGWQDITRVAAGDVEMWTAIVRENRAAIAQTLRAMSADLQTLTDCIESKNDAELATWLAAAKDQKQQADEVRPPHDP